MANVTMETFMQADRTCEQNITCMGCHNAVRNSDFIWAMALNAQKRLPFLGETENRLDAIRQLREIVDANRSPPEGGQR